MTITANNTRIPDHLLALLGGELPEGAIDVTSAYGGATTCDCGTGSAEFLLDASAHQVAVAVASADLVNVGIRAEGDRVVYTFAPQSSELLLSLEPTNPEATRHLVEALIEAADDLVRFSQPLPDAPAAAAEASAN